MESERSTAEALRGPCAGSGERSTIHGTARAAVPDPVPTHLKRRCWDRDSICGLPSPLPVVLARFAPMHIEGHGMAVCTGCATGLSQAEEGASDAG